MPKGSRRRSSHSGSREVGAIDGRRPQRGRPCPVSPSGCSETGSRALRAPGSEVPKSRCSAGNSDCRDDLRCPVGFPIVPPSCRAARTRSSSRPARTPIRAASRCRPAVRCSRRRAGRRRRGRRGAGGFAWGGRPLDSILRAAVPGWFTVPHEKGVGIRRSGTRIIRPGACGEPGAPTSTGGFMVPRTVPDDLRGRA